MIEEKVMIKSYTSKINMVFSIALIGFSILYWFLAIITRATYLDSYFFIDPLDTFMDYFNMMIELQYANPYVHGAIYPAMCFVILKLFYLLLPAQSFDLPDGRHMLTRRLNADFLKTYRNADIGLILYLLLVIVGVWESLMSYIKGTSLEKRLLTFGLMISGPFLYAIERGNFILYSYLFLLLFAQFYKSDKFIVRVLSYICLGISAAIKIYPAVFGLMIIFEKKVDFKEIVLAVVIGVAVFILPFFMFGVYNSLKEMVYAILFATGAQAQWGMGYNFSIGNVVKIIAALCGGHVGEVPLWIRLLSVAVCFIMFFISKEEWKKFFSLGLICVWFPEFSYTYTMLLFVPALISYLNEEKEYKNFMSVVYRVLFLILFIPIYLPGLAILDPDVVMPLNYPTIILNCAIILMVVGILVEGVKSSFSKKVS